MKKPVKTSAPPAGPAKQKSSNPAVAHTSSNKNLNAQNRRVLAQHYRAKYGVK